MTGVHRAGVHQPGAVDAQFRTVTQLHAIGGRAVEDDIVRLHHVLGVDPEMGLPVGGAERRDGEAADDRGLFVRGLQRAHHHCVACCGVHGVGRVDRAHGVAGEGGRGEPAGGDAAVAFAPQAVAGDLDGATRVASRYVSGHFGRSRALEQGHLAGGDRRRQADIGLEGADLDPPGLEVGVLHPGFLDVAGVFAAGAAELVDQGVVEVLVELAVDTEPGAAEVGAVVQVAVGDGGGQARLLEVLAGVEHHDGADIGGEAAVGGGQGRLAVGQAGDGGPARGRRLQGDDVALVRRLDRLQVGQLRREGGQLLLQGVDPRVGRAGAAQRRHLGVELVELLLHGLQLGVLGRRGRGLRRRQGPGRKAGHQQRDKRATRQGLRRKAHDWLSPYR